MMCQKQLIELKINLKYLLYEWGIQKDLGEWELEPWIPVQHIV